MHPGGKKDKNRKNIISALETWIPLAELKQSMGDASGFKNLFSKGR